MKAVRGFGLLLAVVLLGGCANMDIDLGRLTRVDSERLAERVDDWVADRQYGRALEALSRVDPKDPLYERLAQRRRDIKDLAESYEQEVLSGAREAVEGGDWAQALDLYDQALERLPESTVLRDGLAKLHQRQEARLEAERLELLIRQGRWLQETLPIHARIGRIAPRDRGVQRQLEAKRGEADELGRSLGRRGAAALEAEEYGVAERTLPLAAALTDAPEVEEAHARLKQWRAQQAQAKAAERQRRRREAEAREQAAREQVQRLWDGYHEAFEDKAFVEARERLDRLAEMTPKDGEVDRQRTRLQAAVQTEVVRLFEEGVSLYSRGEFEKAVARWQRVLELDPDHRAADESLQRARRVLERVERLRGSEVESSGEAGPDGE